MAILRFISNISASIRMEFAMDGILIPLGVCICFDPSDVAAESSWRAFSPRTSLWEQGGMRWRKNWPKIPSRYGQDRREFTRFKKK